MRIDTLSAPAMITWQLTRDCNLACLHCCTDSAPGRALPNELSEAQALALAGQIIEAQVPYVMLVGGEPTLVPHFLALAEKLGRAEVFLKIETNGQNMTPEMAAALAKLPIRSIQISIDGATQETYAKMRPGGDLAKVKAACAALYSAGLPLEITFAPTKLNIHETAAVVDLAVSLGAFRFNTGKLMRVGTAAKLWSRLEPSLLDYEKFLRLLERKERELAGKLELCFRPFELEGEALASAQEPAGTMLVLPDGKVKVSAALPFLCADLKTATLSQAWDAYRASWSHPSVLGALERLKLGGESLAQANQWQDLPATMVGPA
jgi:MoaA/NifB/PqqE/SkfB family radical SAM enzyme